MARSNPRVRDDSLHVPTRDGDGTSIITLGSAAWDSWVEHARSFRFETPHASFTARKEQRPGGWYWYAYRRRHGTLHIAYLGKTEELSIERLHTVAAVLERAEDSSHETSTQSQQRSFDASLHEHHTSIISSPLALSAEDSQPEARPVPQHNLPFQVTSLVGREATIATATALLRRPEVRLLSMVGTGGIGKTRLAIEVAMELLEDFPDGIFFVALAPLRDPDLVLPTIAHTLGLKDSGSEPLMDRLHTYLRDKHLLLVLDNFEHLMPAAPMVGELLTTCPNLTLLVTSREVLHLSAEQQFSVPPLALPGRKQVANVQSLTEYPALELFLQRARSVKHDFQVTNTNAPAVAEICVRLDGLPLAIELAAARIRLFSPQALLTRLGQRLPLLTSSARDVPARQQTLRQTIQWSYDLLTPAEQRLFRRLAVFVGGCALQAVEAMSEDVAQEQTSVLDTLTSLLDKHLLRQTEQEDGEPWFLMLETIREYGLEALSKCGELETVRHAHAAYYLQLAEVAAPELGGPQQVIWFDRLERERDNLRAALSGLLERGEDRERIEMALRLGAALKYFWEVRSHAREGWTFLERALERSEGVAVAVRAQALMEAGLLAWYLSNYDRGEELCQQSLALFRESGNVAGVSGSLLNLGIMSWPKGELATARVRFEESLKLFTETGDKINMAWSLWFLSSVDMFQGDYPQGYSHAEACLLLFRETGDRRGIAYALCLIAQGYLEEGDAVKAHPLFEESSALSKEIGDKATERFALSCLGWVAFRQGKISLARALLEEGLANYQGEEDPVDLDNQAWVLSHLAQVVAFEGDYARARALYEQCLAISKQVGGWKIYIPLYLEGLAAVVAGQGERLWAARLWGTAKVLREGMGMPIPPAYRADYERSVAPVRTQLGEQAFADAWEEGRAMTLEQVVEARGPVLMPTSPPAVSPLEKTYPSYPDGLTAREVEVLRLAAQGLTSAQIAEQLVLSPMTVNTHVRSIYSKLGVTSRSAATRWAIERHLV